jgi:hypothetical protein
MTQNPYEAPIQPIGSQPLAAPRVPWVSVVGLVLSLPFPILLGVWFLSAAMYAATGGGNEASSWYTLAAMCFGASAT